MANTRSQILAWRFIVDDPLYQDSLYASQKVLNALEYAPGSIACRVVCRDIESQIDDRFICAEHTTLWRIDAANPLRKFARMCALDVAHLWDMPPIVWQYLDTGETTLRELARESALTAASDTTPKDYVVIRDAARAAAKAASNDPTLEGVAASVIARNTAWLAAKASTAATSNNIMQATTWVTAWDAAWKAGKAAAQWDVAWAAAQAAGEDAAKHAVEYKIKEGIRASQNGRLTSMLINAAHDCN